MLSGGGKSGDEGTGYIVATWRTSSYSGPNGGNCVEIGASGRRVLVRDTKDRAGALLVLGPAAWRDFTGTLKGASAS